MTEAAWLSLEATLMTTHAIEAYGGVQLGRQALETAAASLSGGQIPMQVEHDQTRPLRVRDLVAWVEDGDDGFSRLKVRYDVHPDDVHIVSERRAMSVAIRSPLDGREGQDVSSSPFELSADNAWFDDDALIEAEAALVAAGATDIRTERVYQFSVIPDPQIFIAVGSVVGTIGLGALGSALWDAVKTLLRRRKTPVGGQPDKPTRVNIELRDGSRSLTAVIETSDEAVAQEAVNAVAELASGVWDGKPTLSGVSGKRLLLWDAKTSTWKARNFSQDSMSIETDG
ncbi:hypothetical protein [Nocardioides sp. OK12]|uniref:hypothetical protein n=1 Tax=Nocardioides sp. OK12 TaxID=2758661 RepID=UPI0021C44900|nr:hypothetical protein [Nocardioides sp. OK12]